MEKMDKDIVWHETFGRIVFALTDCGFADEIVHSAAVAAAFAARARAVYLNKITEDFDAMVPVHPPLGHTDAGNSET